jgi:hypothetical protein
VRRNGNLVSTLIGDLRNLRNAVPNPVHRQRVNFVSLQQEAANANANCGLYPLARQFVSLRMSLTRIVSRLGARAHENKTESDSPNTSRARSLRAPGE